MDLTNLNSETVNAELNYHGYLIIKDAELKHTCEAARVEYEACLQAVRPHPPDEKFDYRQLSRGPWRKLAIGSRNGLGHPIAQNLQSTYFDPGDKSYRALGSLFRSMIAVRNKLMTVAADFGDDPNRDGFWNACRVHHYPRGGGFMTLHRDEYFPERLADKDKPFYQLLVLLSRKNTDFFTGGGVVVGFKGKRVDVEIEGGFGAMILYDGRTLHGVEDVDTDQIIDFSRADGRMVALVNLYCVT
jgi:hypothetical protein